MNRTYRNIVDKLEYFGIDYKEINHPPVYTCEEADHYIPRPEAGLKSVILQTKKTRQYVLCVLAGSSRVDFNKVKTIVGKKCSFANLNKVQKDFDCDPGAIPPLLPVSRQAVPIDSDRDSQVIVLVDDNQSLFHEEYWYFNPGLNTKTFGLKRDDLLMLLKERGAKLINISWL